MQIRNVFKVIATRQSKIIVQFTLVKYIRCICWFVVFFLCKETTINRGNDILTCVISKIINSV